LAKLRKKRTLLTRKVRELLSARYEIGLCIVTHKKYSDPEDATSHHLRT
jgi:hypothetical protein